jgi:hypothetical protein
VIGGLLAVVGGVAGHVLVHRLNAKREGDKLRRERLESLVKALYAHDGWLVAKYMAMVVRKETHDVASPLDEVRMLQTLHFPQLAGEVAAVEQAQLVVFQCILQEARLKDPEPFNNAYASYLLTVAAVTAKCRALLTS